MNIKSRSELQAISDINVTPLVDVMLVLLVVFIVTAPLLMQAVKVALPKTVPTPAISQTRNIQVTINASGTIFMDQRQVTLEALEDALKQQRAAKTDPSVQLHADSRVDYGEVAKVLAVIQRIGIDKVGLVTVSR